MQALKEVLKTFTPYRGSEATASRVRSEIGRRFGSEAAAEYDPRHNTRTFAEWRKIGYKVKPGEKAIKSFIIVEKKDKETGEVIAKHLKTIYLFYEKQVEVEKA